MIFRRRTTRIKLERTTLQTQIAPAGTLCPRCGALVDEPAPCGAPVSPSGTHPQHEIQAQIQESSK